MLIVFIYIFSMRRTIKVVVDASIRTESIKPVRPPFPSLAVCRLVKVFASDSFARIIQEYGSEALSIENVTADANIRITSDALKNTMSHLLNTVTSNLMYTGLFDPKPTENGKKEVDLSGIPRASSSYLGRILQTICSANVYFDDCNEGVAKPMSSTDRASDVEPLMTQVLCDAADEGTCSRNFGIAVGDSVGPIELAPQLVSTLYVNAGTNQPNSCPDSVSLAQVLAQVASHSDNIVVDSRSAGSVSGSPGTVSIATINSDEDYGSAKFKLKCGSGSTHCRIRAKPSLESPEVGDVANGSTLEISG
jgi:hypothetical protein